MAKRVIRSVVIFGGIIAVFPLCYFIYTFFTVGEGSYWIFGVRDGVTWVSAWVDKNANGIREEDEPPLPGVCIWSGYQPNGLLQVYSQPCKSSDHALTDEQGMWWELIGGGSCKTIYVFTIAPKGYQPTTDLASNGCSAQFGFVENGVKVPHKILSINDFARRQNTILWVERIGIGLFMLIIAGIGTYWLEKR